MAVLSRSMSRALLFPRLFNSISISPTHISLLSLHLYRHSLYTCIRLNTVWFPAFSDPIWYLMWFTSMDANPSILFLEDQTVVISYSYSSKGPHITCTIIVYEKSANVHRIKYRPYRPIRPQLLYFLFCTCICFMLFGWWNSSLGKNITLPTGCCIFFVCKLLYIDSNSA